MKQLFSVFLWSLVLLPAFARSQDTFTNDNVTTYYYNSGNSTDSPQIDALNFINRGTFIAQNGAFITQGILPNLNAQLLFALSLLPYETSSTINYTNTGDMFADVGFRFRNNPSSFGVSRPSRNFFNGPNATVQTSTYLTIQATNIMNRGLLNVSAGGVMSLEGGAVDLSESLLQVPSLSSVASFTSYDLFDTNIFYPAVGVYDNYWSTTNLARSSRQINLFNLFRDVDGLLFASVPGVSAAPAPSQPVPPFTIPILGTNLADSDISVLGTAQIAVTDSTLATNLITVASNIVKQAVFVAIPPGLDAKIFFEDSGEDAKNINVLLSTTSIDPISGAILTNSIRFGDTLGAVRVSRLLQNALYGTYMPTNYSVDRLGNFPIAFFGTNGNSGFPSTNFFLNSSSGEVLTNLISYVDLSAESVTNTIITNGIYSAYSAFIDNVVSRPPNVSGGTFTNLPGSVRITANNLNLDDTKISAQGQVSIHATHVSSTTNALLDCDNLSFDIGSTNGTLVVEDLIPTTVGGRIKGTVYAWSGLWTNVVTQIITNNFTTNDLGVAVVAPLTNNVSVVYHTLILDASGLAGSLQAYVYDLNTHAKNVFINDDMTLLSSMLFDARSVTINSSINLPGILPVDPLTGLTAPGAPLTDWVGTNAPAVLFLTNNGSLTIPSTVHLGDDRPRYAAVVNNGTINAAGILGNAWHLENRGSLSATRIIELQFDNALFGGSSTFAGNGLRFVGNNMIITNCQMFSGDSLSFNVSGVLTDGGKSNTFILNNGGINLRSKPVAGDLLGTQITEFAPKLSGSSTILHVWAAEDRGDVVEGFINNGAIGRLILSAATNLAKFRFIPATGANAIYIDEIDFGSFLANADSEGNMTNVIIDPGMTIYYAEATADGVSIAEKLDGKRGLTVAGGKFRWVPSYAGTFSGADLSYDGGATTLRFNRTLATNQNLDSDNDGTVNFFDTTPLPVELAYTGDPTIPDFPALPFPPEFGTEGSGFAGAAGSYNGLFYTPDELSPDTSGYFSAKTTTKGRYTAQIRIGGRTYSFAGKFDDSGAATNFIRRTPFEADLQLDLNGGNRITGILTDGEFHAKILADRSVFNRRKNPATEAGTYTIVIPGSPDDPSSPQGSGYGTVKVDANGIVRWSGVLADGSKVSQRSAISGEGIWPLYAPLYRGEGSIIGWVQFSNEIETDLQGQVVWLKPDVGGIFYPEGFGLQTSVVGAQNSGALNLTNGVAVFTGGNLNDGITNSFSLNKNGKAVNQGSDRFNLSVDRRTGLFKGSILDPDGAKISFKGAWLKKAGMGRGYFFGFDQVGEVSLTPIP